MKLAQLNWNNSTETTHNTMETSYTISATQGKQATTKLAQHNENKPQQN